MKLNIPKHTKSLIPCLLLLAAAGCATERVNEPAGGEVETIPTIDIELNVAVTRSPGPTLSPASRASAPDDFEEPTEDEERLHNLKVIIVDKETRLILHNRSIPFHQGQPLGDDMRFKVEPSTEYDIYLFGNSQDLASYPGYHTDLNADALMPGCIYPEGYIEEAMIATDSNLTLADNTGETRRRLPLSEKFTVKTKEADGSAHQTQKFDFFITRAAVKFSFDISVAEDFEGYKNKYLTSIIISGIADKEYLLPRETEYSPARDIAIAEGEGRDIISFSTPSYGQSGDYIFSLPEPLFLKTGAPSYSWAPAIYLAESALTSEGISCTLSFDNGQTSLVPVKLPNLPYGLPRNTHVKVSIQIGNNNSLRVNTSVKPWNQVKTEFDYADEVGIASDGVLSFTEGTYLSLNKTTARLVLSYPKAAAGSFGIATPRGMQWDAYLLTESGQPDAIQFLLDDGSTTTRISGVVGSETKDNFEIVSTVPPGTLPNTAILQVVVTTADGRGIPANVLRGWPAVDEGITNLTIIQNPK